MVQHAAIPQLLRALQRSEPKVVEAAVRSLKMVYKVGAKPARLAVELAVLAAAVVVSTATVGLSKQRPTAHCALARQQSPLAPKAAVFVGDTPARLVSLLPSPMSNVPEAAAGVIASCCETPEQVGLLLLG